MQAITAAANPSPTTQPIPITAPLTLQSLHDDTFTGRVTHGTKRASDILSSPCNMAQTRHAEFDGGEVEAHTNHITRQVPAIGRIPESWQHAVRNAAAILVDVGRGTEELAVRGGTITTNASINEDILQVARDIADHSRKAALANQIALIKAREDFADLSRKLHRKVKRTSSELHNHKIYLDKRGRAAAATGENGVTPELRGRAMKAVARPDERDDIAVGCSLSRMAGNTAADRILNERESLKMRGLATYRGSSGSGSSTGTRQCVRPLVIHGVHENETGCAYVQDDNPSEDIVKFKGGSSRGSDSILGSILMHDVSFTIGDCLPDRAVANIISANEASRAFGNALHEATTRHFDEIGDLHGFIISLAGTAGDLPLMHRTNSVSRISATPRGVSSSATPGSQRPLGTSWTLPLSRAGACTKDMSSG